MMPRTLRKDQALAIKLELLCNKWTNSQEVKLRAGEMDAQEERTAMAVLNAFAREVRDTVEKLTTLTLKEYQQAVKIVEDHKMCEGCKGLFKSKDIKHTVQYGTHKDWCLPCYDKIKNEW